jgi:hypothetical protein
LVRGRRPNDAWAPTIGSERATIPEIRLWREHCVEMVDESVDQRAMRSVEPSQPLHREREICAHNLAPS